MLPVTEAFMNAFKASEFECELYESETEDRVHILVNGEVFGPRYLVARFPREGGYVSVMLPEFIEIPKGKSHVAVTTANDLHRTSHLVKFWVDKKNRTVWAIAHTFVQEADAVAMTTDAVALLMNYCNRVYPTFEKAFQTV